MKVHRIIYTLPLPINDYLAHPPQEPRTRCTLYVQVGSLFLCMGTDEFFFPLARWYKYIRRDRSSTWRSRKSFHSKQFKVGPYQGYYSRKQSSSSPAPHLRKVIVRREDNLKAFILGLELLGLHSVIKIYPTLMKPLFTHQDQAPLTADRFRMLIGSVRPGSDDDRSKAFDFFHNLVDYLELIQSHV